MNVLAPNPFAPAASYVPAPLPMPVQPRPMLVPGDVNAAAYGEYGYAMAWLERERMRSADPSQRLLLQTVSHNLRTLYNYGVSGFQDNAAQAAAKAQIRQLLQGLTASAMPAQRKAYAEALVAQTGQLAGSYATSAGSQRGGMILTRSALFTAMSQAPTMLERQKRELMFLESTEELGLMQQRGEAAVDLALEQLRGVTYRAGAANTEVELAALEREFKQIEAQLERLNRQP